MKIAFLVSSVGDANLALATIESMEKRNSEHKAILVALTKPAKNAIEKFQSLSVIEKKSLPQIINSEDFPVETRCSKEQVQTIVGFVQKEHQVDYAFIGVPSADNEIPFQIAEALEDTPVLVAYEFMFKPEPHSLWKYLPLLKHKPNVQWGVPLNTAIDDFELDAKVHVTGHLSIDRALQDELPASAVLEKTREELKIAPGKSLAFVSSTTQPVETSDAVFLKCLFDELPNHPNIQLRLGLHPGIQDLDSYLQKILSIYKAYPEVEKQFKIILPAAFIAKLKHPDLTINNPEYEQLFLRVEVSGDAAAAAAEGVMQAVPGALTNKAAMEGKPAFSPSGKPYLPSNRFAENLEGFFALKKQAPLTREDLKLSEKSVAERYTDLILTP
ncbi:hypothetical protein [Legionella micdadei]|uniref:Uncharacterized protein n=1 Tax=Legionella micdadei TaxID=451 RepID=A0A098GFT5_LEGMI|nr:hypothetical protein [Legionella micdadei]ARG98025.1 hypothetical protein B6N58_10330 [Legionella micdadei]ARH00821.1 hypothetical protein B6V88_10550 [Legionella micdadei]KTD30151.1 hypothetical protein Lmic_0332 [Legionella micdadei]NSL18474.1 hypothetical protein [Legionella micdadei]CEG60346.1 protein of unknown function [Legionella micdadei]